MRGEHARGGRLDILATNHAVVRVQAKHEPHVIRARARKHETVRPKQVLFAGERERGGAIRRHRANLRRRRAGDLARPAVDPRGRGRHREANHVVYRGTIVHQRGRQAETRKRALKRGAKLHHAERIEPGFDEARGAVERRAFAAAAVEHLAHRANDPRANDILVRERIQRLRGAIGGEGSSANRSSRGRMRSSRGLRAATSRDGRRRRADGAKFRSAAATPEGRLARRDAHHRARRVRW